MRASYLDLLCQVLAPGCPVSRIPVRRGEKWHETVISAEEAEETYDTGTDGYYVIGARESGIAHGWQRVLDGFELRSDTAPHYTKAEMARVLLSIQLGLPLVEYPLVDKPGTR
jgi:FlaA1/EpsC-like NDP-sugar epimerase